MQQMIDFLKQLQCELSALFPDQKVFIHIVYDPTEPLGTPQIEMFAHGRVYPVLLDSGDEFNQTLIDFCVNWAKSESTRLGAPDLPLQCEQCGNINAIPT